MTTAAGSEKNRPPFFVRTIAAKKHKRRKKYKDALRTGMLQTPFLCFLRLFAATLSITAPAGR
jgi:hypothetical protein